MNGEPEAVICSRILSFQLDPTLTGEEAIVLRTLLAGKNYKQVRNELHMSEGPFLRLLLDLREKTGARDKLSVLEWSQRRMQSGASFTD